MLQLMANRNKRSLALNLKNPEGIAIARELVATADVVAENYRPGVMDKLGLGFEQLRQLQPRLIYAAASGFGQEGPYAQRPGQDLIIQALSGTSPTSRARRKTARARWECPRPITMGPLCSRPDLAALVRRERTGEGGGSMSTCSRRRSIFRWNRWCAS